MNFTRFCTLLASLFLIVVESHSVPPQNTTNSASPAKSQATVSVIAHRGASGYLPEHSLAAKAMAHAMGADFLEQDIVLSRDNIPLVLHDIHLDTVTNVATEYPSRARPDGRFYAIDFELDEIKSLRLNERIDLKTGKPVFANRFPGGSTTFQIPTLREELEFIRGLNKSTNRNVGIYPEIKKPGWHKEQGSDITLAVLDVLAEYGFKGQNDNCFLQCFDPGELIRIREDLNCKLKLIQLTGANTWNEASTDYEAMLSKDGLKAVAKYADGIGPWIPQILLADGTTTQLVETAHELNLLVHPYTFRADDLPAGGPGKFEGVIQLFCHEIKVDGIFTDFPDQAQSALQQQGE